MARCHFFLVSSKWTLWISFQYEQNEHLTNCWLLIQFGFIVTINLNIVDLDLFMAKFVLASLIIYKTKSDLFPILYWCTALLRVRGKKKIYLIDIARHLFLYSSGETKWTLTIYQFFCSNYPLPLILNFVFYLHLNLVLIVCACFPCSYACTCPMLELLFCIFEAATCFPP